MVSIKDVQGSKESAKPLIIGVTTVYVHSNIVKLDDNLYQYDEIQYSLEEWDSVKDAYYAKQRQIVMEEQVTSLEAALCDIYELLISNNN